MKSSKTLNDLYLLFKSDADFKEYERNEITPAIRFKAKDYINFSSTRNSINDGTLRTYGTLTIITNAKTEIFSPGDIIVNVKTDEKWRVDAIVVDDSNKQKQYGNRVDKWTILSLKN